MPRFMMVRVIRKTILPGSSGWKTRENGLCQCSVGCSNRCWMEMWVSESNAIPSVPELMQILSFMSSHKCLEFSKYFFDGIPKTVDEMLKRVDDYVKSEAAFRETKLPRGESQRKKEHAPYILPYRPQSNFPRLRDNRAVLTLDSLVPRRIIKHTLNANPSVTPVIQKQRILSTEKSQAVSKEVEEWLKVGIVRPVKYLTWISNPVLVKKGDGSWRMCIDFKFIYSACLKDYYPLLEIDLKIKSVEGFPLKFFLDAYKGYSQVQMDEEDEEKLLSTLTR
nr:putative reverse transcriptase domain-containing protein [Tanacetum cinerariifolium]